ncbi:MAG: beta-lactamase family protein [Gemmatimonadetes bacterium]|nr:beta-lactamase family protein [Gemmatimonadota bacterium]
MRPTIPGFLVLMLALASGGVVSAAQSTSPTATKLFLAGSAKRYCSGIWVSGRDRTEALNGSVLQNDESRAAHASGALRFEIDDSLRTVTATRDGVSARARYFGDQGCVILPDGTNDVFFTPRPVVSTLPDAASMPWPMGDLVPGEPLPANVDSALLDEAAQTFFGNARDLRAALVVVYKGRIIAEQYGSGAHRDMQLESWSMGKSMTATLIGRLIQMGHIRLWDPAPVPEWQNSPGDARATIRIADLLRMSSGLQFSGGGSSPGQMARSFIPGSPDHGLGYTAPIDIFRFSASRPPEFPPNTVGRYRNSDPWMLGYVVRRTVEAMGEEYLTWPQRSLFDRIGIRRFVMETDPYGNFILTGYNFGTARNWARLGLLYLQEGMWNGERLLPREFVEFVRTPAPAWDEPVYGGLFWVNPDRADGTRGRLYTLPPDTYYANGAGYQRTYIIPSRELVIVMMSHRAGDTLSPDRDERALDALGLIVRAVDPTWSWNG